MNVYIYGNSSFKKEIHETLEHANIKFKLDSNSVIKEINSLDELKNIISNNPNDIYLIDDEKIIKKNGLAKKIKFLTPKDGIEEEFLLDNGIADLSVDSLNEIPKYILQKYEQQKEVSQDIQESIADIVDEAYTEDSKNNNEDDFELDDELAQFLSKGEESSIEIIENKSNFDEDMTVSLDDNNLDFNLDDVEEIEDSLDEINIDELDENTLDSLMNFNEDVGLNNVTYDYDDKETELNKDIEDSSSIDEMSDIFDDLENDDIMKELDSLQLDTDDELSKIDDSLIDSVDSLDLTKKDEPIKGEKMSDEFSELDLLSEADILSALDGLDNINIVKENTNSVQPTTNTNSVSISNSNDSIDISSSSSQDIANLISKLLNNKTLEITIKIKD